MVEASLNVAVVTPYFTESEDVLRRCHDSVARQTHPCLHVMVADGFPQAQVDEWSVDHIRLPRPHGDIGSSARLIGAVHAMGLGVEAIAFLDADNWYRDDHVEGLLALQAREGAAFLSSSRTLRHLDGSVIGPCPITDPERFIDTNCMMFTRPAFSALAAWVLMPAYAHLIGDRVMLHHVKMSGTTRAHTPEPTVNYTCGKAGLYRLSGIAVPVGVSPRPDYAAAHAQWLADGNPPVM